MLTLFDLWVLVHGMHMISVIYIDVVCGYSLLTIHY